jgi:hypothetical protein
MAPRSRQKFILAGGKIVPADDAQTAGQQAVNKIAANKTGGAGDKNLFHDWARSLMRSDGTRQPFWKQTAKLVY